MFYGTMENMLLKCLKIFENSKIAETYEILSFINEIIERKVIVLWEKFENVVLDLL